jgi:hypothetical protein
VGVRRRSIWLPWLFWLLGTGAWADEPSKFAISQVSFRQQVITAYLDVLDQNGRPPAKLEVSNVVAKLQGQSLKVIRAAPFDSSGEGVAYLFMIDISKSIKPDQFKQNKQLTKEWIDGLSPPDRMGLVTFGDGYHQLVDFTADQATLQGALAVLEPTDRETTLYLALKDAVNLSERTEQGLPSRRVVIVLSDGLDEGSSVAEDEVLGLLDHSHIPVYAIGSTHLRAPYRQRGLDALDRIAGASGGLFRDASAGPLTVVGKDLKDAIRDVFVVSLACDSCQPTSQTNPLEISLIAGARTRTSLFDLGLMVPAPPPPPPQRPWWKSLWVDFAVALLVVALSAMVLVRIRRKKPETKKVDFAGSLLLKSEPEKSDPFPAGGLPLRFTTVAGKELGREYRLSLTGRVVVGRDQGCDLALPDDTEVSGRHCELSLAGRGVELTDLKSSNGTLLNGARVVARERLESGDLIRVGRTELRVSFVEPK